jgi:Fe-S oxidoreductase
MLDLAEAYLRRVLEALRDEIRAGTPVVGIEPSCVAVFKDELLKLWPMNQDAKRLAKQTFHFSEFLCEHAKNWKPPQLHRKALLHGHCHQRATGGTGPDKQLLERMGLEVEELESGCCGMAGGWGYEHGHYDVSVACGERVLLPKVRAASPEAAIVADGFSCRSQIQQLQTGRRALHVAQVLALARGFGPEGPGEPNPERAASPRPAAPRHLLRTAVVATGIVAVVAAVLQVPRRCRDNHA